MLAAFLASGSSNYTTWGKVLQAYAGYCIVVRALQCILAGYLYT